jgi:arylsulfatase
MFEPLSLRDGESVVEAPVDQSLLTEKYTQRASDFIRRHRQQPFFLFLSHTMPHIPQYASPAFQGQSRDGLYGDAIEELDASTGRILDTLRECQLAERTWVIFTSDNGAGVRGKQAQGNAIKSQPSKAQGRFPGRSFGGSNGVLRGGKGTTWEGGVRVPCIVWSPGNVGQPGEISSPICTMDFFPTFAGLNGGRLPESLQLDGVDLGELWRRGVAAESSRPIYHYFGVQLQAIRRERWKLILPIQQYPRVRVASVWFEHQPGLFERQHRLWPQPTLYDLVSDPAETVDVAGQHPEVVASLQAAAESFDTAFQQSLPPVSYLPGPMLPPPGRVRTAEDDITAWLRLVE